MKETCESCRKNNKTLPIPKFSLPRACQFNEMVTIDLKGCDRNERCRRYICYLVDMHSRFVVANFIPNKYLLRLIMTLPVLTTGVSVTAFCGDCVPTLLAAADQDPTCFDSRG